TDVINSTGQINVDFADVCTVMRNGGVAILGSAAVSGEDRAHKAIEEALNSPLLNDNDISGAKWILININSAEGEHEFTMDEVEVIQHHLVSQAGEGTDVIMGLGYDNTLGNQLGITLIATGFQHREPFSKPVLKKEEKVKEEKIVMVLGETVKKEEKRVIVETPEDLLAPKLVDDRVVQDAPMPQMNDMIQTEHIREEEPVELLVLKTDETLLSKNTVEESKNPVGKMLVEEKKQDLYSVFESTPLSSNEPTPLSTTDSEQHIVKDSSTGTTPGSAASGGYQLARPSNIYAEFKPEVNTSMPPAEKPVAAKVAAKPEDELSEMQMQLVEKDIPAADMPLAHHAQAPLSSEVEDLALRDETDDQKRRAAERLHK
ncbi:MAG: cell division protein FtsZ, partial [Chitinophagaceae bacterium]